MYAEETTAILELFADGSRWCQNAEAKNARGAAVKYNAPDAVAWDLTGGLCFLFGWARACVLFRQIDKHLLRDRSLRWRVQDAHIESMLALQDMNDRDGMTYEWLKNRLEHMPLYERHPGMPAEQAAVV